MEQERARQQNNELTAYEHDDDGEPLFTIRIRARERDEEGVSRDKSTAARERDRSNLTLPKPTDVSDEKVKYSAVMYFDVFVGPDAGSESL